MIELGQFPELGGTVTLRLARDLRLVPQYHTAAFWIDGLLVDTGCAHTAGQLLAAILDWPVEQVVNTHSHEDHIGANTDVQSRFHCPIRAHSAALPILANPRLQPLQPYRRLYWGWPKPCRAEAVGEYVETRHHRFQVIPTPGHSPDSISLFEPEQGWLFTGDAYVGGRDRALRDGYDIYGIIASLKRLAELPVRAVFSGSGSVRTNGAEPLRDKAAYLEEMGTRIRALHDQGLSPRQIRRRLLGPEMSLAYLTLGHFSGMRLVQAYLAKSPR